MKTSPQEQISHVVRRASMGAHPDLVAGLNSVDGAIARVLDLSGPAPQVPIGEAPASIDAQRPV